MNHNYPVLTATEIKRHFGIFYFERGMDYWKRGHVMDVSFNALGNREFDLSATVSGSQPQPYYVDINLKQGKSGVWAIMSECSCPIGYMCKHVVAALLTLQTGDVAMKTNSDSGDRALSQWLADWRHRTQTEQKINQRDQSGNGELHFVLATDAYSKLSLELHYSKFKKDGSLGKSTRTSLAQVAMGYSRPGWLGEDDALLLLTLRHHLGDYNQSFHGITGSVALELLLNTNRCHWQQLDSPALTLGAPVTAQPAWQTGDNGSQQFQLLPGATLIALTPPYVLKLEQHSLHRLDTQLDPVLAQALCNVPAVMGDSLLKLIDTLQIEAVTFPMPANLPNVRDDILPHALLRFGSFTLKKNQQHYLAPHNTLRYVETIFVYGDTPVASRQDDATIQATLNDQPLLIRRQRVYEKTLLDALPPLHPLTAMLPFEWTRNLPANALIPDAPDWLEFCSRHLPLAQAAGWQCENLDVLNIHVKTISEFEIDIEENAKNDWFDISLDFNTGSERINLLPLLQHYTDQLVKLPDNTPLMLADPAQPGHYYRFDPHQAKTILSTLVELFDDKLTNGKLRLPAIAALRLAELPVRDWRGGKRLRAWSEQLRNGLVPQTCAIPPSFHAELRPYQQQGLNWLQTLRAYQFNGLLADDMGLGKTVQTLAHIAVEKHAGRLTQPALIICPTSLVANWKHEAARFTPELKIVIHHGAERTRTIKPFKSADLVISSYPILARDSDMLAKQPWYLLVLDEAQSIKNVRSKNSLAVRTLNAQHRLALTGTPMENHLGELWSLFDFLMPGLLGDEKQFRRVFRKPIEDAADDERRQLLIRRIAPLMLRRKKQDVVKELPEKIEVLRTLTLDGKQRELYETVRIAMQEKIKNEIEKKGLNRSQIVILDALLKLRQVCCDPQLVKLASAKAVKQSAKMEFLLELLPELIAEGRRILLFSQFTGMLDLIEAQVRKSNIPYVRLDGQTKNRETPVQQFQNGNVPLFLISLKAGGVGLNLTAADTVIHYDPWWNPAAENQATDRAHRIGQNKTVFVYKLICEGTVEEKIHGLQQRKQALADGIYSNKTSEQTTFSGEDLNFLLQTLPD